MENTLELKATLAEIQAEIEKYEDLLDKKCEDWDYSKPFQVYQDFIKPETEKLSELGRQKRLIMIPEFEELSNIGHLYTLEEFISNVECGGFIDYDGYGYYVRDNMESNIMIKPTDVRRKMTRTDFTHVMWYNR